jgi:ketol-acid reductoisomerase
MRKILSEIQSGQFAKGWVLENQANRPMFHSINEQEKHHPLEVVGRELRAKMPFIQSKKKGVVGSAKG